MAESRAWDLDFYVKISVQENIKINSHNRRFSKRGPVWTTIAHFGQIALYIYTYIYIYLHLPKVGHCCPKWATFGKMPIM